MTWMSSFRIPSRFWVKSLTCIILFSVVLLHGRTGGKEFSQRDEERICFGCMLFAKTVLRSHNRREITQCPRTCSCKDENLACEGVRKIKDGCGCCFMCARQHGDLCNEKELCDEQQNLYCEYSMPGSFGVCRSNAPKSCIIQNQFYQDGEKFQPDCRRTCTCQNGNYGCVNLCSQEDNAPSPDHCPNAQLTEVRGHCCKEWTCNQKLRVAPAFPPMIESENLMMKSVDLYNGGPFPSTHQNSCAINKTHWSACSVTCGVGVSVRTIVDRSCTKHEDTQLCYLRPCGGMVKTLGNRKCTATTRTYQRQPIVYNDCRSVRKYRVKHCTTCKRQKCCFPRKTETRKMMFRCLNGHKQVFQFEWIKRCRCSRHCRGRHRPGNVYQNWEI